MTPHLLGTIRYYVLSVTGIGLYLFFLLSLYSFHPADPPGGLVFSISHTPQNFCGESGAFWALRAFSLFGLGVWFIMLTAAYHLARFLAGCHSRHPYLRFGGWCVTLLGVSAFLGLAFPHALPFIMIGSGGFLGVSLSENLAGLGTAGAFAGSLAVACFGLMIYSDRFLPWASRQMLRLFPRKYLRGMLALKKMFFGTRIGRRRRNDDYDSGNFPFHGLYCGYLDMDAYYRHSAAELSPLLTRSETLINGRETLSADSPEDAASRYDAFPKKPKAEVTRTPLPGRENTPGEIPAKSPEKDAPKVLVDEKSRRITIIRPEDNKMPSLLADETPAASAFQAEEREYVLPSLELLQKAVDFDYSGFETEVRGRAEVLEKIVERFGFKIKVEEIQLGPVITQYQISLDSGLRVQKIVGLADDIAVQLGVSNVRIVHPLPGKTNLVGIEIPNLRKQWVYLRQVMEELAGTYGKMSIPMFLGKDVAGKAMMTDLAKLPHLLIAGRTGTGKSVCLNSIIISILMTRGPADVKMIMIDPKMVELSPYASIPHLMHPVITDMKKAEAALAWAVDKMEERYTWLSRAKVRHVDVYNKLSEEERLKRIAPQSDAELAQVPKRMPYIVIIADEMADLMMTAPKEVESHIIRLAQKSRAVGIHLILATQKPTVDVITGLIKSNLPARIAFQVSSKTDSRVVLDENGADRLLGNGDMLFLKPGTSILVRGQGTYLGDEEIQNVINAISVEKPQFDPGILKGNAPGGENDLDAMRQRDEMYVSAVDIIVHEQRGSISLLQRMLGIGYGRAARLIDYMAEDGIVGPFRGYTQPREVLMSIETWEAKQRISGTGENSSASAEKIVIHHAETQPAEDNSPPLEGCPKGGVVFPASGEVPEGRGGQNHPVVSHDHPVGCAATSPKEGNEKPAEEKNSGKRRGKRVPEPENDREEDALADLRRETARGRTELESVVADLCRDLVRGQTEWEDEDFPDDPDDEDFLVGGDTPQPPWDDEDGEQMPLSRHAEHAAHPRNADHASGGRHGKHGKHPRHPKKPKKNRFRQTPKSPQNADETPASDSVLSRIEPNQPAPFIRPGKLREIHSP